MKKVKVSIFLAVYLFVLIGCKQESDSKSIIPEVVDFNVGFNITKRFSGVYYDSIKKEESVYFADPTTRKQLKIFDGRGTVSDSVDLKKLINVLGTVNDIAIYSSDTIMANSLYTNKLAFINRKGELWKYINLNKYMVHEGGVYEISSSSMTNFKMGKSLLFSCERRSEYNDSLPSVEKSAFSGYKKFYENSFNADYFFRLDNVFSDKIKPSYGLKSFYSNVDKVPAIFPELSNYTYVNGKLLISTIYSDKIFVVNNHTLTIEKAITVKSDYTDVGTEPIPLSEESFDDLQALVNQKARTVGFISGIFFNKNTNHYNVILYHENKDMNIKLSERPFSVIVLDEEMNQINEILFSDLKNYGDFALMTNKGLMIYSNTNSNNPKNREKKFNIYNF